MHKIPVSFAAIIFLLMSAFALPAQTTLQSDSDEAPEGWGDVAWQVVLFATMIAETKNDTLSSETESLFSLQYSEIRAQIFTKINQVRENKRRVDGLIDFQSRLLQSYNEQQATSGQLIIRQNDDNCQQNAILCQLLPYTFDRVEWD